MIHIDITAAAFEAIARTMLLGSVAVEGEPDDNGARLIRLEPHVVNRLRDRCN